MMIQAVLGNPHHPEYGVATIPFPIPRDQYAHCMELLEALEIGDAVKADCKVEEIDSFYTVHRPRLYRLQGRYQPGRDHGWQPEQPHGDGRDDVIIQAELRRKQSEYTARVRMVSRRSFRNRRKSSDGSMSAISLGPACG